MPAAETRHKLVRRQLPSASDEYPQAMGSVRPVFLKVSCILVGLQTAVVLTFAAMGLTLTTSQRVTIDLISGAAEGGASSLTVAIGSGLLGVVLAGLLVMLVRGSRFARWVMITLEVVTLIFGLLDLKIAVSTGLLDPFNLGFTAGTVLAPAVILFALIVNRAVHRYFRPVRIASALPLP